MDELVVRTTVYAGAEEVYELLLDFPRYERYTEYLERVDRIGGEGGAGSLYALHFAWWKLGYTAHSEVTAVDPPKRIDWRVTKSIDASGSWRIDPVDGSAGAEDRSGRDDGPGGVDGLDGDDGPGAVDIDVKAEAGSDTVETRTDAESESGTDAGSESGTDAGSEKGTEAVSAVEADACEVTFEVQFDPGSASPDAVDLPRLVSFDWVLRKAMPLIKEEAERVVERAVADLEGRERSVELDVRVDSDRI